MDKICDAHTDFLTELKGEELKEYLEFLRRTGNVVSCAVFTTHGNFNVEKVGELKNLIKNDANLLLSIEDLGFVKNAGELNEVIKLKPFSATLTWNADNQFAGGAFGKSGITKLGKLAVKKLEEGGVLVDCAHLNKRSFYQLAKITTYPLYCSHANIYTLKKHRRNLTDKQIKLIKSSGGFLGLTIYEKFIANHKISSRDVAAQIDYLIKNYGDNFFGIGSDLFGFDKNFLPADVAGYEDFKNIKTALINMGYNKKTVHKIFYLNFYNFAKKFMANK